MAYVTPNSTVQLFTGLPFNKDAEDTVLWDSRTLQDDFFAAHSSFDLTFDFSGYSYIRATEKGGVVRVGIASSSSWASLHTVNYLRFKNASHENKWFYAFVTSVDYVDEGRADVTYEIDPLQTWLPGEDYELTECRIVRQHQAVSDNIGDNIQQENIEVTEYSPCLLSVDVSGKKYWEDIDILRWDPSSIYGHDRYIAVLLPRVGTTTTLGRYIMTFNWSSGGVTTGDLAAFPVVQVIDRVPCADPILLFDQNSPSDLADLSDLFTLAPDFIKEVWAIPKAFISSTDISTDWTVKIDNPLSQDKTLANVKMVFNGSYSSTDGWTLTPINARRDLVKQMTTMYKDPNGAYWIGSSTRTDYKIKNNKCLTNPYCFYQVTGSDGSQRKLFFEKMNASHIDNVKSDLTPYIKVCGSILETNDSIIPYGYDEQEYDMTQQLGMNPLPVAVIHSAYDNKSGQLASKLIVTSGITAAGLIAGGVGGAVAGEAGGMIASKTAAGFGDFAKSAGMAAQAATARQTSGGTFSLNDMGIWAQDLRYYRGTVQYANNIEDIDMFFNAYGYTQNKFATPVLKARTHWTYIQTNGSSFKPISISADALKMICDRFDQGIRFHTSVSSIGHLTQQNDILV